MVSARGNVSITIWLIGYHVLTLSEQLVQIRPVIRNSKQSERLPTANSRGGKHGQSG